jgi:pilus assembly protein Flp/PilA
VKTNREVIVDFVKMDNGAAVMDFVREEDGVALTEYLILLALLTGGVILAIMTAGGNLAAAWQTWGAWWTSNVSAPTP